MKNSQSLLTIIIFSFFITLFFPISLSAGESVNVFSYREEKLVKPIVQQFTKETGIKVNLLFADKGLIERIQLEGKRTRADVLLTTDIGNLTRLKERGLSAPIRSHKALDNVPKDLRDDDNHWIALTIRARIIFARKGKVTDQYLDYSSLSDDRWKGRICIRSGKHSYNIGLFANLIEIYGEKETEEWLGKVKNNLARKPQGNDRSQSKGIYAGICDLAIMNTYYFGLMANNTIEPNQKKWAEAIYPTLPSPKGPGANINISGMAVIKYAKNPENANKLIEFMTRVEIQNLYATLNHEFPVNPAVKKSPFLEKYFGGIKLNTKLLKTIPANMRKASDLVDKVSFDN